MLAPDLLNTVAAIRAAVPAYGAALECLAVAVATLAFFLSIRPARRSF